MKCVFFCFTIYIRFLYDRHYFLKVRGNAIFKVLKLPRGTVAKTCGYKYDCCLVVSCYLLCISYSASDNRDQMLFPVNFQCLMLNNGLCYLCALMIQFKRVSGQVVAMYCLLLKDLSL